MHTAAEMACFVLCLAFTTKRCALPFAPFLGGNPDSRKAVIFKSIAEAPSGHTTIDARPEQVFGIALGKDLHG